MFSSITSKLNASFNGSGQQHTPQYTPTPPQNYNNAPPQVPAPWMVEWSSGRNCWLYINRETGQSSWVNPSQQQPQLHYGYQATTFSPPQQQSQFNYQNTGFAPLPQDQYNPAVFYPLPQQQSQGGYQPSYQSPPPQQAPQPHPQTLFQPPPLQQQQQQQQQQSGFQGRPAQQYQQQRIPQNVAPAQESHKGRNIASGLGALVAGVVGIEKFTDKDNYGNSGGDFYSSRNDSSSANNGGTSDYTTSGFGGDTNTGDYTTPSYGVDTGIGDGGYSQADGQALLDAQDMVSASEAQGSADMASAIW